MPEGSPALTSTLALTTVPGSLRGPEDTGALAVADHAPPPFSRLFNEPSKIHTPFASPCSPSAGKLFTGRSSAGIIECASIPSPCHASPRVGHATFHIAVPAAITIAVIIAVTIAIAFTVAATVTTIIIMMTTTKMPCSDRCCPMVAVLLLQLESPLLSPLPPLHPYHLFHLRRHSALATITVIPATAPSLPPLPSPPLWHCHLCHPCRHNTVASAIPTAITLSPPPLRLSPRHHAATDAALGTAIL